MTAKFGVSVDEDHSKLRHADYLFFIKDPISQVLLLVLVRVLILCCLYF